MSPLPICGNGSDSQLPPGMHTVQGSDAFSLSMRLGFDCGRFFFAVDCKLEVYGRSLGASQRNLG